MNDDLPVSSARMRYSEARPWGQFDKFVENEPCSVKIITVAAGAQLSLQSHHLREEWWIVLDEAMDVEIDGERRTMKRGEDVYIRAGVKHRVFGLKNSCRWLEIAFGTFDENDIIRYEDAYGRISG